MIKLTVTEVSTFRELYEDLAVRHQRNKTQRMKRKLLEQLELLQKIIKNCEKLDEQ